MAWAGIQGGSGIPTCARLGHGLAKGLEGKGRTSERERFHHHRIWIREMTAAPATGSQACSLVSAPSNRPSSHQALVRASGSRYYRPFGRFESLCQRIDETRLHGRSGQRMGASIGRSQGSRRRAAAARIIAGRGQDGRGGLRWTGWAGRWTGASARLLCIRPSIHHQRVIRRGLVPPADVVRPLSSCQRLPAARPRQ